METSETTAGVRESRRRAMLARDIVDQLSGPRRSILSFTEQHPLSALAVALVCGLAAGVMVRNAR